MLRADLREAAVGLLRRPWTTALAIVLLALGIGANAAIFSLVDAVLFKPLPVAEPERLVRFLSAASPAGDDAGRVSQPFVAGYRQAASLSCLATWSDRLPIDVAVPGRSAERLTATAFSPGFFDCLGLRPAVGRIPGLPERESDATVVLGHRFWQRVFDGDPGALGTTLRINRQPLVIVGVTPAGFEGLGLDTLPDLWLPLAHVTTAMPAWRDQLEYRSSALFHAVGRLAPNVDRGAAQAELGAIAARLGAGQPPREGPETEDPDWREPWPWLEPASALAGTEARLRSRLLVAVAALVLALACADVAGLRLARAEERRREFAVRIALGGSRWQVVRPLMLEAVLLAVAGTAAGLVVARLTTRAFLAAAAGQAGWSLVAEEILSSRVLLVTASLAMAATVLAGVWPAFRASRVDPQAALRGAAPAGAARWVSPRGGLVSLQAAVATVLLVASASLLQSLWAAATVDPGMDPDRIVLADLEPARGGYDTTRGAALAGRLETSLATSPGVVAAALSVGTPLAGSPQTSVTIDGQSSGIDFVMVTPDYFKALRIPLLRGRTLGRTGGAPVGVVVNDAFARRFWPGTEALGRVITNFTPRNASLVVTGIVPSVRTNGLRQDVRPVLYVPFAEFYGAFPWQFSMTVILRTSGATRTDAAVLAKAVHGLDPLLPVLRPRTLSLALAQPFAEQRLLGRLLGGFAVVALLLAGAGLYGVLSMTTQARTREFGIRLALGARPRDLRWIVQGRALVLCGMGLGLGLCVALVGRRLLEPFVFGVSAVDGSAMLATGIGLLLVAWLAAEGPARRATRVQVAEALRRE
jgi:predicted permease